MLKIIIGIVFGIFVGYLTKKQFIHIEIKSLKKQLQMLQKNNFTHTELSLKMESSEFVPLVNELNTLLGEQRFILEQQRAKENQLLEDIANISHDLRTPLTALYGYLELLKQTDLSEKSKKQYLDIALSRTEVLQSLIQNLFYLTRLQAKDISLKVEPLSIQQILKEQAVLYFESFEKHDIKLSLDIEETGNILTNREGAERIVNNLLSNIIEHGTNEASISVFKKDNQILTRFTNAFDPAVEVDLLQIFDRHYMGIEHRNTENSGLGLTIIRELTNQLDHEIKIHIEDGQFIVIIAW